MLYTMDILTKLQFFILALSIGCLLAAKARLAATVLLSVAAVLYGYLYSDGSLAIGVFVGGSFIATTVVIYFVLDYVVERRHKH